MARGADLLFAGHPDGLVVYRAVAEVIENIGPVEIRPTKSQIAFRRSRGFAFVWRPGKYLRRNTVPVVLSLALPRRLRSRRFKQIVQPSRGLWMHHLELASPDEVDAEVTEWIRAAYRAAG